MEKEAKKLNKKDAKPIKAEAKTGSEKKDKKSITEVKAAARFVPVSAKKARLIVDQIRGAAVEEAETYLNFANKAAVLPISKLLHSAIANAEHNFQLDKADLFIKKITANGGPVLKRWMPKAHGRATTIRKQTSHIELVLGIKDGAKIKASTKGEKKSEEVKIVKPQDMKKDALKVGNHKNKDGGKGEGDQKGFVKGIFQRKTG
ncbi:MAG: 50S ribosomal protein L22 [Candidatus Buchananbacteria bacterium]